MSANRSVLLLVIILLLGGAWYAMRKPEYTERGTVHAEIEALGEFNPEQVNEIQISMGDATVGLVRRDDSWVIRECWDYPANGDSVNQLLKGIRGISDARLRAESPESHESFEVDSLKGRKIELTGTGDGLPLELIVGKSVRFDSCFVRNARSDKVYVVKPNLILSGNLGGAELQAARWLDKKLYELPEGVEVEEIVMNTTEGSIRLKAKPRPEPEGEEGEADPPPAPASSTQREWQVLEPEAFDADPQVVRAVANRLRSFYASDAADPTQAAEYGLENPEQSVEYQLSDGETVRFEFGNEELKPESPGDTPATEKRYYVRRHDDPRIFVVSSWARDGCFKSLDELRPPPPTPEEPAETSPSETQPAATQPPQTPPAQTRPADGGEG